MAWLHAEFELIEFERIIDGSLKADPAENGNF